MAGFRLNLKDDLGADLKLSADQQKPRLRKRVSAPPLRKRKTSKVKVEQAEDSSSDHSSEGNHDAFTNFNNPMSTTPYKATLNTNQSEESDEVMQLPKIPLEEKFVSFKSETLLQLESII